MKRRILLGLLAAGAALMTSSSLATACAVCVTGANDPSAQAFNWSVLFLMASPYLVVGSVVGWLVYNYRRAAAKREPAEAEQPLVPMLGIKRRVDDE
jgi:heme/copper-type cytochrome/quinol oxidase subunit 2